MSFPQNCQGHLYKESRTKTEQPSRTYGDRLTTGDMAYPGWDPGTEKGYYGKSEEVMSLV